jgi:hypothetical protein
VLELRSRANRLPSLQRAVYAECRRVHGDVDYATLVSEVAATLAGAGSGKHPIFVVVICAGNSTLLMVRDPHDRNVDLDERRREVLEAHAIRWSTMRTGDERTITLEIARAAPQEGRHR